MKKEELLDSLEDILTSTTKNLFKQAGMEITDKQAGNLIAKIGTRIMFSESLGKENIDKILL